MNARDRLQELIQGNAVAGIDFIYVHEDQLTLDVFFFKHLNPPQAATILGAITTEQVRIYSPSGGEGLPEIEVTNTQWVTVDNRDVLRLTTGTPGNFALYRLHITHNLLDDYFNDVLFSFKANCPSDLDCEPDDPDCPPEEWVDFPVDYRARDFHSFRRALLEFADLRYPDWADRLEADVGIMLVEVMSALGDELAYYQDRIGDERYLATAGQRRSLRHHARLVDYEIHNGRTASTWLDVELLPGQAGALPAGADVWALSDQGRRIAYEIGRGLADRFSGVTFAVDADRNELLPHIWDEDDICLPVGATEMVVQGHQAANLPFDDPVEDPAGKWLLLKTTPISPADPERRWLVRIVAMEETRDRVFNEDVTRLEWEPAQALPFEMNLTELTVRGNLVPATAGRTVANRFTIGADPLTLGLPDTTRRAVEREGANDSTTYLASLVRPELLPEDAGQEEAERYIAGLTKPEGQALTWLGATPQAARPEIRLSKAEFDGVTWTEIEQPWEWRRSLLGVSSSLPDDRHFTLEDGTWDRVVGYWRSGQEIVHHDYAANEGYTIRFGDGEFGLIPAEGDVFQVTYRLGNGRQGNVPADSITHFDPGLIFVAAVSNPLPAEDGQDPETLAQVKLLAPEAFRYETYRAVRPEDYAEAVERLDFVQRAGAKLRWTGSWLTLFATPDPFGAVTLSAEQQTEVNQQLDRFRQAGREAYVYAPQYANLDLEITICVQPFAYIGEVKEAVLEALLGVKGGRPRPGFFSADNFTFGTPLKRSVLEKVIQEVPGVRAVESISIRRRGWFDWRNFTELAFMVGVDEVIRVENDPLYPDRGSVRLVMEGGA